MMKDMLIERLQKLGWHHTAHQLDHLLEDASRDNVSYSEFLNTIVLQEMEYQESQQLEKRMKRAKLPYIKTIHDFGFSFQPSISEKRVKETLTCRFIAWGKSNFTRSTGCWENTFSYFFCDRSYYSRIYRFICNRRRFSGRMPKGKRKRDSPTFSQSLESPRRTHY